MMPELQPRWDESWRRAGVAAPAAASIDAVVAAHREPPRAYHHLGHVLECLDHLASVPDDEVGGERVRGEIELALWFHDAVYDARAGDNEARSAAMAVAAIEPVDASLAARVRELILATRHTEAPSTPAAAIIVDVDLAILGASPARFDAYERSIREEYAWVEDAAFVAGRLAVLEGFLGRPRIYATDHFAGRLGSTARANLRRSIGVLKARGH